MKDIGHWSTPVYEWVVSHLSMFMFMFMFMFQAYSGHVEAIQVLMNYIINLDIQDNQGRTPLHLSACRGHTECCENLIMSGATILARDCVSKATPLHTAGKSHQPEAR